MLVRADFDRLLERLELKDRFFSDLIFRCFSEGREDVQFDRFVQIFSIVSRGTPDEKLNCIYFFLFSLKSFLLLFLYQKSFVFRQLVKDWK